MIATTRIDVFRDADAGSPTEDVDSWGDPVETDPDLTDEGETPILRNVPASIIEKSQRVRDDAGGLRPVRYVVGRVHMADIREGDRIKDQKDGAWYSVEAVSSPQSPIGMRNDLRLELERV